MRAPLALLLDEHLDDHQVAVRIPWPTRWTRDKKLAASPAVAVEKKKNARPFPAVLIVSLWALLNAAIILVCFASATVLVDHYHVNPPWWLVCEGTELTAARAAALSAIFHGALWCSAAAAAAAAPALLLPDSRRRSRWALACAALAATAATHLMWATATTLFLTAAADSCLWWMWIVGIVTLFFAAAGDVVYFLALSSAD
ncbi:uncharacterized protein LOC120709622 [Panicum virgatum]|uniref:uncharacterized protein LOC120709622 n=1 Tax=Panicum virgatum TaxID=38727 RepID=UPI0019D53A9B|nr:uncharacterized protein LOC120709622 [Panicum virgatum]